MKKISSFIIILTALLSLILTTVSLVTASGKISIEENEALKATFLPELIPSMAEASVWEKTTVDGDGNNGVSLALDSTNAPHVSYLADDANGGTQDFLKYAVKQNDMWTISQVSDQPVQTRGNSSLILDTNDSPHIAFGLVGTISATPITTVTLAFKQGGNWNFENIDVSETPGCCADHYRGVLLSDSADTLHLFYYVTNGAYSERQFKYARRVGSNNWQVTTLFGSAAVSLFSVDIDSEDNFHLVYKTQNEDINTLYYSKFSSIDQFSPEVIYTQDDARAVANMSITVDNSDTPYIVFAADGEAAGCNAVYTLYVAHQEVNGWSIEAINSRSHARNALVFDSQNIPHVFSLVTYGCTYSTTTYVEYYYKTQDGWQEESLGSKYNTGNISFALDELDNFHGATIGVYTGTASNAWLTYHYRQSDISSSISGTVTDTADNPILNATVSSSAGYNITTDLSGNYAISALAPGTYIITVEKEGYTFSPASRTVTVPPNATGQDFTGSPNPDQDTDGDGLLDDWEIKGYDYDGDGVIDVDLPAMGADSLRKDIFVEIDYLKEERCIILTNICITDHTHKPKDKAIELVINAFAEAPVLNPDGSTGINLHVDYGPESIMNPVTGEKWGELSQGNSLQHQESLGTAIQYNTGSWWDFDAIKGANFAAERGPIFHYSVFAHFLGGLECTSGISRGIPANDFIVTLGGWGNLFGKGCGDSGTERNVGTTLQQAGTFMHELGHNLGLGHGGDDNVNYKPNYLSIMNYSYQTAGLIIDGQDTFIDYSAFGTLPLNENDLNESVGLNIGSYGIRYWCGEGKAYDTTSSSIDWNCDGNDTSSSIQANINKDSTLEILTNYNDWANLTFIGTGSLSKSATHVASSESTIVDELTEMEASELVKLYDVVVTTSSVTESAGGNQVTHTLTIANLGQYADVYTINATSSQGWADLTDVPITASLASGESTEVVIKVSPPPSVSVSATDELKVSVVSQINLNLEDSVVVYTTASTEIYYYKVFLPSVIR